MQNERYEVYFSYYQKRDNVVQNFIKYARFNAYLTKELKRAGIPGATFQKATGVWESEIEPSTVGIFYGASLAKIRKLATGLKRVFNQDSVLVVSGKKTLFL